MHISGLFTVGCMRTFSRYSSLRKHILKEHPSPEAAQEPFANENAMFQLCGNGDSDSDTAIDDVVDNQEEKSEDDCSNWNLTDDFSVSKQGALFIAKLKASSSMTLSNVELVMENTSDIYREYTRHMAHFTKSKLKLVKETPEKFDEIMKQLNDYFECNEDPFTGLKTQYKANKYFMNVGALISPIEIILGTRLEHKIDRSTGTMKQCLMNDTMQYIPPTQLLKNFLQLPGVWDCIQEYNKSVLSNGCLRDFHDGNYYKNHQLLSNKNCIVLGLYNDDMETTNPLGSHTSVHKLGFFYYIIKNLPPKYNSVLKNCHLLQVYHSEDRKKYSFNTLLEYLVEDLKTLASTGLDICVNDELINVKVAIGQVSGDNLGMHGLFGFVESFIANHPCRHCLVHKHDMQGLFFEDSSILRDKKSYSEDLERVYLDPNHRSNCGIVTGCLLNELDYFHVTENYTPDVMHDLLEGICPYIVRLFLCVLMREKKLFDLNFLNDRIQSFNYGSTDMSNKPPTLSMASFTSKESTIRMSASEMWCFVLNLPLKMICIGNFFSLF